MKSDIKTKNKYDFPSAITFLAVAALCILPFTQTIIMQYAYDIRLINAANRLPSTYVLMVGILSASLLFVLEKTVARFGKNYVGGSKAALITTAILIFCSTVFVAATYPAAWSELIDINVSENTVFHFHVYFIFVLPLIFLAATAWSFSRALKACPSKLIDTNKIKNSEAKLFVNQLDKNRAFTDGFCTFWTWIYLSFTALSLVCLTVSQGISFAQSTQNFNLWQRDAFYFLFGRNHYFSIIQTGFALIMFALQLYNRCAVKSPTQNFVRMLPFVRMLLTFAYTVVFALNFPLICRLSDYFDTADRFATVLTYILHIAMPVLLLAAFWADTLLSMSKTKAYRDATAPMAQLPRTLRILHGAGYGLCCVFAALALSFPFFIFQGGDGINVSIFLYGSGEKNYYPSIMPDGGVGSLTSINTLIVTVIIISAFSLIIFTCSKIIRRPLFNIYTLTPYIVKITTTLLYTVLFAVLLSDLQGTRSMFLTGTHSNGIFIRHLGWHCAFVTTILLLLILWADVVLSSIVLIRNRKKLIVHTTQRKVNRLEAKMDKVSSKLVDAETDALSQRMAELEAELVVVKNKLSEKENQNRQSNPSETENRQQRK